MGQVIAFASKSAKVLPFRGARHLPPPSLRDTSPASQERREDVLDARSARETALLASAALAKDARAREWLLAKADQVAKGDERVALVEVIDGEPQPFASAHMGAPLDGFEPRSKHRSLWPWLLALFIVGEVVVNWPLGIF